MQIRGGNTAHVPKDYVYVEGIVPHTNKQFYHFKNTSQRVAIKKGAILALPPAQAEYFIMTHKVRKISKPAKPKVRKVQDKAKETGEVDPKATA